MTDRPRILSDELIEAALGLRAPGHVDAELLGSIVSSAAVTPQVPLRRHGIVPATSRTRVWVALAVAALLAGALFLASVGGHPRPPIVPDPSASPNASGLPAPSGACATDSGRVKIGADMPPRSPNQS